MDISRLKGRRFDENTTTMPDFRQICGWPVVFAGSISLLKCR